MRIALTMEKLGLTKKSKEVKKEGQITDADVLFNPLQALVLEYLDENQDKDKDKDTQADDEKSHRYQYDSSLEIIKASPTSKSAKYKYQPRLTLLGNIAALNATQAARNLLSNTSKDSLTDAEVLFDPLKALVTEYLGEDDNPVIQLRHNQYKYQSRFSLLHNLARSYATHIAHNLLWHIDIEKTLEFAKQNPASLLIEVEVKDPHGQRVKGTVLQIVAAAGDRNTRKMKEKEKEKEKEKDYGLVERLRSYFPNQGDYEQQLKDWFEPDSKKEHTSKTMAPYVTAIKTFCQQVIEFDMSHLSSQNVQTTGMALDFHDALKPDPKHVVTSGMLFDLQIFLDFFEIWKMNVEKLGGWTSHKSILFAAVVYSDLQARVQQIDLEIFMNGLRNVIEKGHIPDHCDSNSLRNEYCKGYFFFLDAEGRPHQSGAAAKWLSSHAVQGEPRSGGEIVKLFQLLCQTKISVMDLGNTPESSPTGPESEKSDRCLIM